MHTVFTTKSRTSPGTHWPGSPKNSVAQFSLVAGSTKLILGKKGRYLRLGQDCLVGVPSVLHMRSIIAFSVISSKRGRRFKGLEKREFSSGFGLGRSSQSSVPALNKKYLLTQTKGLSCSGLCLASKSCFRFLLKTFSCSLIVKRVLRIGIREDPGKTA